MGLVRGALRATRSFRRTRKEGDILFDDFYFEGLTYVLP